MAIKDTLILGVAGAAAIYTARQVPAIQSRMDSWTDNKKLVPLIPVNFMAKNSWSALFWILPAAGAWYLSN